MILFDITFNLSKYNIYLIMFGHSLRRKMYFYQQFKNFASLFPFLII